MATATEWGTQWAEVLRLAADKAASSPVERYRCWTCKEPIVRGDRCVCGRGWFVERVP